MPEGRDLGKPVKLRPWQRREMERIYDNPAGTRRAIISFGRKNGKTSFAAFLLLLHLCGPKAKANSQLYSAAQSRDQAAVIFNLAAKIVRLSPEMQAQVVVRDTTKQLYYPALGSLYRALSAEVKTSFGLSPSFIVHDELGQVRGPTSPLYEALETATGAQDDPLSLIISTQAPTDGDLLSTLIDDALGDNDPRVVVSLYTAPLDADAFSDETIKQANPAFGDFLNEAEVRGMARDAERMPARENEYRNLVLNQRVEASSPFVSLTLWASCNAKPKSLEGGPVYGGLDLAEVNDLTALILMGRVDGIWQIEPTFWLPGAALAERARKDHAPYDLWAKQGYLVAAPGKSIDYDYVAEFLVAQFERYSIQKIGFDRWHFAHLRPCLSRAGLPEEVIDAKFVEFGQGSQSMTPALRALEGEILNGRIAHGAHPVLRMCAANAVVQFDTRKNRTLSKAKSTGRIDGMVALAMAFGVAPEGPDPMAELAKAILERGGLAFA